MSISSDKYLKILIDRHTLPVAECLRNASIGIAGLGGLGSHVAAALTRMGVGEIVGADFDIVELSNIHRQYYFLDQVGMKKCDALAFTLQQISTVTSFMLMDMTIDKTNAQSLFAGCDVIIEAFDVPEAKSMLLDTCIKHFPDTYYIGASGIAGYGDKPEIVTKKLGEKVYIVGDMETDISQEALCLMAGKVGLVAHMQANLAVKLLLERV